MASYRRAAWYLCWWGCLFGVLQVAHGAERISVPQPSIQDLLNRANPVLNENPLGYVQAHDSSFVYQQRSYSAPIQQKIVVPDGAFKTSVKGALKANAAAVAVDVAMAGAIAAVGWVMKDGVVVKPLDSDPNDVPSDGTFYYYSNSVGSTYTYAATKKASCNKLKTGQGWTGEATVNGGYCYISGYGSYGIGSVQNKCASGSIGNGTTCIPYGGPEMVPVTEADYGSLDQPLSALGAQQRANLLKTACAASPSPARCYQALQDAASFLNSGPSSIQGPKATTTTTNKNADGSVSTETTTKDTKFDMKYDGTGATATPNTTTTKKDGKGGESVTTEKEDEDSGTGTAPKPDDEKETASPCTTNCDGPAYKDLYTKTDVTKEGVLDTYAAKVKALPIMSAVGNFFTVNGGGSCPVWSGTIDIGWGQSVTLSNDFACQPWFTALSPAFHAVLMLVAAWLAFRVSILD